MTGCIESDVFVVVGILGFAVVFGDGSDADDVVVARSIVSVGVIWGKQRSGIDIDVSSSGCMFVLKFSSAVNYLVQTSSQCRKIFSTYTYYCFLRCSGSAPLSGTQKTSFTLVFALMSSKTSSATPLQEYPTESENTWSRMTA